MSSFTIDTFDFVIINSGYTARLLCEKTFSRFKESWENMFDLYISGESKERIFQSIGAVYMSDSCHGTGRSIIYNTKDVIDELVALKRSGSICFTCSNIRQANCICEVLMNTQYCGMFSFSNMINLTLTTLSNGKKILSMGFDTEAGCYDEWDEVEQNKKDLIS